MSSPEHDDSLSNNLAADLQAYQAAALAHISKFSTLITSKASRFRRPLDRHADPTSLAFPTAAAASSPKETEDSLHINDDDSADVNSDSSQNLAGFEGLYERTPASTPRDGDGGRGSDDADSSVETSSTGSAIMHTMRAERIQAILNNSSSGHFHSSDGEQADSAAVSEDEKRLYSATPRRRLSAHSRRSAASSTAKAPPPPPPSVMSPGVAAAAATPSSGPQSIIPWDLVEPFRQIEQFLRQSLPIIAPSLSSGPVPSAHYQPLTRMQIVSVLRVTKGNVERGQKLCLRYSALLDRLGLGHVTRDDIKPILDLKCMCHVEGVRAKDGSSIFFLRVRRLPRVAASDEYAVSIIRAMLFLLEHARRVGALQDPADGGDAPDRLRRDSSSANKSNQILMRDCFTFLVDVSRVETNVIHDLGPALAFGRDLLQQSYPLRVPKLVLYNGGGGAGGDKPLARKGGSEVLGEAGDDAQHPETRSGAAGAGTLLQNSEGPPLGTAAKQKKGSVLSFLTRKDDSRGLAGKMWLSVTVSAFKLKYLPSTIRSRVTLTDKLDSLCIKDEVNSFLEKNGFELL